MIIDIDVNRIFPHPNNPRKDLGDLTELADSIKINGVLQNLTIVPKDIDLYKKKISSKKAYPGDYIAVIGHRRHAAAKLAGLTKVPCVISYMDEKTQVATMLLENLQRSDLTIYEQAQGFQMMLDFGESVSSISEKTGFSETTVRRRVKLLDLDKDKFRESAVRGATLFEYAELDKIRNTELKNSVLDEVGTPNFKYKLKEALDQEKQEDNKAALIAELEKISTPVKNTEGLKYVQWFSYSDKPNIKKPDDADTVKYYFLNSKHNTQLFRESTLMEIETKSSNEEAQQKLLERRAKLKEISNRAFQLRTDFIRDCNSTKKHARDIMVFAVQAMLQNSCDYDMFLEMLGIEPDEENENLTLEKVSRAIEATPERALLIAAYCNNADSSGNCYDWHCKFRKDEQIVSNYDFLEKIGYEMSDEERAFCTGTHELFICDNKETSQTVEYSGQLKAAS